MADVFFLSYATQEGGLQNNIERFFDDLSAKVSSLISNRSPENKVGFVDKASIMAGTPNWIRDLSIGLRNFPVGIVLLSPHYISVDRPWCKWEYKYLKTRNEWADNKLKSKPKMLLIINWINNRITSINDISEFGEIQFIGESIVERNNIEACDAIKYILEKGLDHTIEIMEASPTAKTHYKNYLKALSEYIVVQWNDWKNDTQPILKEIPEPPEFDRNDVWNILEKGFYKQPPLAPLEIPSKKVFVLYLAAKPNEVREIKLDRCRLYYDFGECDWQAFADACTERIGDLIDREKSNQDIEIKQLYCVQFSDDNSSLNTLTSLGGVYPILLLIDPWSCFRLDKYRKILDRFGSKKINGSAFIGSMVIWNNQDYDVQNIRTEFEDQMYGVFNAWQWYAIENKKEIPPTFSVCVSKLRGLIRKAKTDKSPKGGSPIPRITPN